MPVPGGLANAPEHPVPLPRPVPGKRVFDVVLAAVLLVLVTPLMAVATVLVLVGLGRPVLFRQCPSSGTSWSET